MPSLDERIASHSQRCLFPYTPAAQESSYLGVLTSDPEIIYCSDCADIALQSSRVDSAGLLVRLDQSGADCRIIDRTDDHDLYCGKTCARCCLAINCAGCLTCEDCNERHPEDSMYCVDGDRMVCESCYDDYGTCEVCDVSVSSDDLTEVHHGRHTRYVCDSCRDNEYRECESCNFWGSTSEGDMYCPENDNRYGCWYCEDCYTERYTYCEECEETYSWDNVSDVRDRNGDYRTLCNGCNTGADIDPDESLEQTRYRLLRSSTSFCDCEECETIGTGLAIDSPICLSYRALVTA